jgi:hypothetical protein
MLQKRPPLRIPPAKSDPNHVDTNQIATTTDEVASRQIDRAPVESRATDHDPVAKLQTVTGRLPKSAAAVLPHLARALPAEVASDSASSVD